VQPPRGPSLDPWALRCCSAGPGRAALGFISRRKFYSCNYTAVNCTEPGSREGEQPPAHEQKDTFTPSFVFAPAQPRLCSDSVLQQSPLARTRLLHLRGLRGDPRWVCLWPSPHGWGPEPGCAGCRRHQRSARSSVRKGHPETPPPAAPPARKHPQALPPKRSGFPVTRLRWKQILSPGSVRGKGKLH